MKRSLLALMIALAAFASAPTSALGAARLGTEGVAASPSATVGVIDTTFGGSHLPLQIHGVAGDAGHGTWMSSAVADTDFGTAPGAAIVAYVCDYAGSIDLECAARALESLLADPAVRVVSMSFVHSGGVPAQFMQRWSDLAARANSQGVLLLASTLGPTSFPASVPGIVSVSASGSGVAGDVTASDTGSILDSRCMCESAVEGVSYTTAWAAGVASRLLGAGASHASLAEAMSGGRLVDYVQLRSVLGLPPIAGQTAATAVPAKLNSARAVWRRGLLTVSVSRSGNVRWNVRVAGRRVTVRASSVRVRVSARPRVVVVRSGAKTLRVRVR